MNARQWEWENRDGSKPTDCHFRCVGTRPPLFCRTSAREVILPGGVYCIYQKLPIGIFVVVVCAPHCFRDNRLGHSSQGVWYDIVSSVLPDIRCRVMLFLVHVPVAREAIAIKYEGLPCTGGIPGKV